MERLPDPMAWLGEGIPLTLLIDLLSAEGPASVSIYESETADLAWTARRYAA
jgi:hypothetical protein